MPGPLLSGAALSEERITAVSSWQDAPYFTDTDTERAALALVEATLQPAPHGKERVCDELYAEVAKHYDEKALATASRSRSAPLRISSGTDLSRPRHSARHDRCSRSRLLRQDVDACMDGAARSA
ncbi:hypothetical protein [Streptomyces sp. NPDC058304]|uniref:hypothetical protein n=1 Tax=Streptomyces sp. NPDC058304 TaxID=3346437 RepID=UPI0036E80EB5